MRKGIKKPYRPWKGPSGSRPSARGGQAPREDARGDSGIARRNYTRYLALARAAALAGDLIESENRYQHAEHYFRLMKAQEPK